MDGEGTWEDFKGGGGRGTVRFPKDQCHDNVKEVLEEGEIEEEGPALRWFAIVWSHYLDVCQGR